MAIIIDNTPREPARVNINRPTPDPAPASAQELALKPALESAPPARTEDQPRPQSQETSSQSVRREDVERVVEEFNRAAESLGIELNLRRDERSEIAAIGVVDSNSGQTLRQLPPEAIIRIAPLINDVRVVALQELQGIDIKGLIIDERF